MPTTKKRGRPKKTVVEKKPLTNSAFDVILVDREYKLVTVMYNPESKEGEVKEVITVADNVARAMYEIKKVMTNKVMGLKG